MDLELADVGYNMACSAHLRRRQLRLKRLRISTMKTTKFLSIVSIALALPAGAATYYVDAGRGSDSWTGQRPDPVGTLPSDGPWQSLAKLLSISLAPGDVVSLRCGSVWAETLKIGYSGTQAAPISIRTYPAPCVGGAPTIDGFARIKNPQWVRQGSNLYKVALPLRLLGNSTFDQGLGSWRMWSPLNDAQLSVLTNCGPDNSACLTLRSGGGTVNTVAYSDTFSVVGGASYRLGFDFKMPSGARMRAIVRRAQAPFDAVGTVVNLVGTGTWQSRTINFSGTAQLDNARLDFELPPGTGAVQVDNVVVERNVGAPFAAMAGSTPLVPAHHPQRGFSALKPTSPFFTIGADADVVGQAGSSYLPVGPDFALPAGASLAQGTVIRIRSNAWTIDERKVSGVAGGRILLDRPTSFPLRAGWGYYFIGSAWMLDEANEWLFDPVGSSVLVRVSSDAAPTQPLALATLETCIDLTSTRYVAVEGLSLTGCRTGVSAASSLGVALRSLSISDVAGNGIYAPASLSLQVVGATVQRAGEHGVIGVGALLSPASGMVVSGGNFIDVGVSREAGSVVSLPVSTLGALVPGGSAVVAGNIVSGSGYHGIRAGIAGVVSGNSVTSACLHLDDCGGIYGYGDGNGARIESNIVQNIPGGQDGKPAGTTSQGEGIFLDDGASGFTVRNNTVSDAEVGIFLHNANNNTVQGNVLYANRKHQIWLREDATSRSPDGDVYGNRVVDNLMFATTPTAAIGHQSLVKNTALFGTYDRNRYSALLSPAVVSEDWPNGSGSYTFAHWQQVTTPAGIPRLPDLNGSVVNPSGFALFRIEGSNLLRNGAMTSGTAEWTPWSDVLPMAALRTVACGVQACLEVTGGGSDSLVASPPFSLLAEKWYRVSFDVRSLVAGQSLAVRVRRGGGGTNGYESLMGSPQMVSAKTVFERVSFAFKATKSVRAADPISGDIGARLYVERVAPGNRVYMSNFEVVPISSADATMQTRLLINRNGVAVAVGCPDAASNPAKCGHYVDFATGLPVVWPKALSAMSSAVVFTRDTTLVDSDLDGISDSQDQCLHTPAGAAVDSRGCQTTLLN